MKAVNKFRHLADENRFSECSVFHTSKKFKPPSIPALVALMRNVSWNFLSVFVSSDQAYLMLVRALKW
jgi:hypothetical protein